MRSKLSLTICLAAFAACVVAGTAVGQDEVVGSGEGAVEIDLPDGEQLEDLESLPSARTSPTTTPTSSSTSTIPSAPARSTPASRTPPPHLRGATPPAPPAPPAGLAASQRFPRSPAARPSIPTRASPGLAARTAAAAATSPTSPAMTTGVAAAAASPLGRRLPGRAVDQSATRRDPNRRQPRPHDRRLRPGPDRGPELRHRPVLDPALPAADLPGLRHPVRDPWQVLASINRIETAFGTNLNVSSAGAMGWMQFIPSSWEAYGVDANDDGRKDPYNPVDAICAAGPLPARRGRPGGPAPGDLRLQPRRLVRRRGPAVRGPVRQAARDPWSGSLTGLTEGAHFPVAANARYADDISERGALKRSTRGRRAYGNAAEVISSSPHAAGSTSSPARERRWSRSTTA